MMAVQLPGQTLRCSSNALAIPYFHPRKIYLDSPKVNFWGKRRKGAVCSISSDENSSNSLVRKRKIVEHICLLKAKKDLSEDEEKDMLDHLYTSQYHMGGIVAISLGQTLDQNPENYTHAVYMRFQKKDDLTKFYENPLYLRVLKDHVTPHCQHLLYFDFESDVEDDILAIFRKGEEFNYGVEFMLLIKFIDSALNGTAADALTSLANLAAEFPSLIVQSTQGCNFNPTNQEYTHGVLIRFLSAEAQQIFLDSSEYKQQIVPPVLNSFSDQDSRVRYYACEALYNIAKVVRGDFIVFFNQIFDALCKLSADSDANVQSAAHLLDRLVKDIVTESDQFSIEEFIPLLKDRMNVLNPYVRQFLVGWITVLDSVPDIDMLGFLPDFLDGLFNMLSDSSHEIRQQADSALSEFLQEIKNSPSVDYGRMAEILVQRAGSSDEFTRLTAITWINEFVKLGGDQLVPYYAEILGAILPCISDKEEKIRVVARETNEELRSVNSTPGEGFDVEAILAVAKRHLLSVWEATRVEALHWISTLLERHREEVLSVLSDIFNTLLKALSDPSDEVVLLVISVLASVAKEQMHFHHLVVYLVENFRNDNTLLEKRGALIIRRLCVLLGPERVYRELSTILESETNLDFASIMIQALNLILLTSSELSELRVVLKQSLVDGAGKDLFDALYPSWCHCATAIISLCFLAQMYQLASTVIQALVEEDINVKFLVQLDKLIRLLETPTFAYLRLQLLEPGRYTWLLKTLYGLLMLLPQQSAAFKILRIRLKTVPSYFFNSGQPYNTASATFYSHGLNCMATQDGEVNQGNAPNGINLALKLEQFQQTQQHHRSYVKSQEKVGKTAASLLKEVQVDEENWLQASMPDVDQSPPRSLRNDIEQLHSSN